MRITISKLISDDIREMIVLASWIISLFLFPTLFTSFLWFNYTTHSIFCQVIFRKNVRFMSDLCPIFLTIRRYNGTVKKYEKAKRLLTRSLFVWGNERNNNIPQYTKELQRM